MCGPAPFMDVVEGTLLADGVDPARIHIERFTPDALADRAPEPDERGGDGHTHHHRARAAGRRRPTTTRAPPSCRRPGSWRLAAPSSCESGSCATCMAKLLEGTASMRVNNALTADEVVDGWVLTCQALPTSPTVHVSYDCEEG